MSCVDCCFRTVRWIPVLFIVAVIGWSYYAYVVQLLVVTLPEEAMALKVILGILYHGFLFMFGWAYFKITFTEPSGPPIKFYLSEAQINALRETELHQDREAGGKLLEEYAKSLPVVTRTHNQGIRYCDTCKLIKPDRVHHCSVCKKCVLKMDHHCPWVNNCVSYSNYKFFILFLFYAELYCLFVALSDARYFAEFWTQGLGRSGGTNFHVMFLFIVSIMFACSVIGLLGYHLYLVCRNHTTLESFRAPIFHETGPDKHGFDLGRAGNWRFVFGDNAKLWFIPVQSHKGDGVHYPTRGTFRAHAYNYNSMDDNALSHNGDAEYGGNNY